MIQQSAFRLDARRLDDLAPLIHVRLQVPGEFVGRTGDHFESIGDQARFEARVEQSTHKLLIQALDDRLGRSRRRDDPEPLRRLVPGQRLGDARHVRSADERFFVLTPSARSLPALISGTTAIGLA